MPDKIKSFVGKNSFLSNFYRSSIIYEGDIYPTVEHAFQAMKTLDDSERFKIASLPSPGQAKRAGRRVKLRDDWEEVKIDIMRDLLKIKFQEPYLAEKLLSTGDAELIEGNYWGDTFWGMCDGRGSNHLGKLLMEVRDEIKD